MKELEKGVERARQDMGRLNSAFNDYSQAQAALQEEHLQLELKLTGNLKVFFAHERDFRACQVCVSACVLRRAKQLPPVFRRPSLLCDITPSL